MIQIVVRHFSDRKKPCLMLEEGNQGIVLGTFRNEWMVELFKRALGGDGIQRQYDRNFFKDWIDEEGEPDDKRRNHS